MIKPGNVIIMRNPYPNLRSGLVAQAHMYIVRSKKYDLIKVQTYKPQVLQYLSNYLIENADPNRNPFKRKSLIDLDKNFVLEDVCLPVDMCTHPIASISESLSQDIAVAMAGQSAKDIWINIAEFLAVNPKATKIQH